MTTRERYAITGGILMVLLVSRFAVVAAMAAIGSAWRPQGILIWLTALGGLVLALPLAIETIDRVTDRTIGMLLLNVAHGLVLALISVTALVAFVPVNPTPAFWADLFSVYADLAGAGMLISAGATGVVRAIRWYRAALAAHTRTAQLEAEETRRTRELIERRLRPRMTAAWLERIAGVVASDRPHAERLLFRLARHERKLLSFDGAREKPDGVFAPPRPAAAAPVDPPAPRLLAVVPLMLAYIAICIFTDRGKTGWEEWRMFATASLISVAIWIVAAPLLDRAIARVVTLRFAASGALAMACIVLAALIVTLASFVVLAIALGRPVRALLELGMVVSQGYGRNILLALTVGASSFAMAFTRVLLAAHAAAARLMDEQVQAETRELEARFHPHFLLNALTSIAALVRMDAQAAAVACRRLAELVERTTGCAGQQYWTVGQELDLVSDYVAVQRMRFQERLGVEEWDTGSVARATRFPRLVLQPLVENVFKHGVARSPRTTHVGLSIRRSRRTLRLTIWNDAAPAHAPDRLGRGLAFVIRRVRAAGGDVTIDTPDARRFRVRCAIPIPA
ncbi:MAG TPA: sensor histidine kinase [Thermoanaerobaculia bacterium]